MLITERRLRKIIRQTLNEMEGITGMESYYGAEAHAKSIGDMLSAPFESERQLMEPMEALGLGAMLSGEIIATLANPNILSTQFLVGMGICAGAALWVIIEHIKQNKPGVRSREEWERLQEYINNECPQCEDDVKKCLDHPKMR